MADSIDYTTLAPERWDTIAFKCYGDPNLMSLIIEANPDVSIDPIVPSGITLIVPIIDGQPNQTNSSSLPPWKQ